MVGMLIAAFTTLWMKDLEPRYVFLVGVVPALLTFWIRKSVDEPEVWEQKAHEERHPSVWRLFEPGVRRTTFLTLALTSIALTTVWAFLYFVPQQIQLMGQAAGLDKVTITERIFWVTVTFTLFNIAGNFFATYLAKVIGYRRAFFVLLAGSFVAFYFGFRVDRTFDDIGFWINMGAFFSLGIFGIFPLYIPPLFPTLLRTTGAGFSYNFGRIISGSVLIYLGLTAAKLNPSAAIYQVAVLYLAGMILAAFMPELKRGEDAATLI
jgi:hypothetical protein